MTTQEMLNTKSGDIFLSLPTSLNMTSSNSRSYGYSYPKQQPKYKILQEAGNGFTFWIEDTI
jgi:hypothetical protein